MNNGVNKSINIIKCFFFMKVNVLFNDPRIIEIINTENIPEDTLEKKIATKTKNHFNLVFFVNKV